VGYLEKSSESLAGISESWEENILMRRRKKLFHPLSGRLEEGG